MKKTAVTLYSIGCPKCDILKKKLSQHNIEFTENNNADEMRLMGMEDVPMLMVNGELLDYAAAVKWINSKGAE